MNNLPTIPKSTNTWCGPAAIAALTGCTPDEAASTIANVRNYTECRERIVSAKGVKGTYDREIKKALRRLGFSMTDVTSYSRHTPPRVNERFKAWADRTREMRGDRLYLVSAGRHWIVVRGWQAVCGLKREPHHTNCASKAGSKIRAVFEIASTAAKKEVA
jgi:hypothetical protein